MKSEHVRQLEQSPARFGVRFSERAERTEAGSRLLRAALAVYGPPRLRGTRTQSLVQGRPAPAISLMEAKERSDAAWASVVCRYLLDSSASTGEGEVGRQHGRCVTLVKDRRSLGRRRLISEY